MKNSFYFYLSSSFLNECTIKSILLSTIKSLSIINGDHNTSSTIDNDYIIYFL
jgi:hypothetical protein